jgi:hypothetical protein
MEQLSNKIVQLYHYMIAWFAFLLCMREVSGSDLGRGTGYSDEFPFFREFPSPPTDEFPWQKCINPHPTLIILHF